MFFFALKSIMSTIVSATSLRSNMYHVEWNLRYAGATICNSGGINVRSIHFNWFLKRLWIKGLSPAPAMELRVRAAFHDERQGKCSKRVASLVQKEAGHDFTSIRLGDWGCWFNQSTKCHKLPGPQKHDPQPILNRPKPV